MNNRDRARAERRTRQIQAAAQDRVDPAQRAAVALATAGAAGMDAFTNAAARMGYGTPSLAEGTQYSMVRWSNDYWLMMTLYRNHWLARRIVETPPRDMVRAWPKLITDMQPKEEGQFNRMQARLGIRPRLAKSLKWAELFGGGAALMVIDGQENMLDEPLDLGRVQLGDFRGLIVFDRWSNITPSDEIGGDISRPLEFGEPLYYEVRNEGTEAFRIHSSRILIFRGPDVPNPEHQAAMRWGISRLEIVLEELRKRDNASWSVLQLLFRAQIIGQRNPELAQLMSGLGVANGAAVAYQQRMAQQNELLSNQSMLILGKDGELFSHQFSFGGLSEVYQQFQLDVAGAAEQPVSRLFGRTITGLGQTGEGDEKVYEERIAMEQEEKMRPQLDKLYPVMMMSEFGDVDESFDLLFPSIRVPSAKEKAEQAQAVGTLIVNAFGSDLLTKREARTELRALGAETGIFTNLQDDDIDDATLDEFAGGDLPDEEEDDAAGTGEEQEQEKEPAAA